MELRRAQAVYASATPRRNASAAQPSAAPHHQQQPASLSCPTTTASSAAKQPQHAAENLADAAAALAACLVAAASPIPAALADPAADVVAYDNAAGSENLKTVFGVGYVALVAVFAVRLLRRRAARAKSERLAGSQDGNGADPSQPPPQPQADAQQGRATPFGALYGAAQAAFLATILWTLTTNLSGYFDSRPLPSNYTASNITVAVKTAVEGLAYLLTFIFGANAVGLSALAVQLLLFPESAVEVPEVPKAADPNALPKIKLTDNIYDIRRAFEEVQQQTSKSSGGGSGSNGSGNEGSNR